MVQLDGEHAADEVDERRSGVGCGQKTHGSEDVLLQVMLVVPPEVGLVGVLMLNAIAEEARARARLRGHN